MWGEAFQGIDLGEIQELMDTTPEELTEDDWLWGPDNEEEDVEKAGPETKLTLDDLAGGIWLLKTALWHEPF